MKHKYFKPKISVSITITENGIAAGSADVQVGIDGNGKIEDQWDTDGEDRNIDW